MMMNGLAVGIAAALRAGSCECMICLSLIADEAGVWSCSTCYKIMHRACINNWAECSAKKSKSDDAAIIDGAATLSSSSSSSFRCPGCQCPHALDSLSSPPTCFCSKQVQDALPLHHRDHGAAALDDGDDFWIPHSCGQTCGRLQQTKTSSPPHDQQQQQQSSTAGAKKYTCPHPCVARCHPGPCDPCTRHVGIRCFCGATTVRMLPCKDVARTPTISCGAVCGKLRACGRHRCWDVCHDGPCPDSAVGACREPVVVNCHCGKLVREARCGDATSATVFSCDRPCELLYSCRIHTCRRTCHGGSCNFTGDTTCPFSPSLVTTCNCGKKPLTALSPRPPPRRSCTDPIPSCNQPCRRLLSCGSHRCEDVCHEGECAPCPGATIDVACRCGATTFPVNCADRRRRRSSTTTTIGDEDDDDDGGGGGGIVPAESSTPTCNSVCNTLRSCGRHQCSTRCCASRHDPFDSAHVCPLPCGRPLSCGNHPCPAPCHKGPCGTCIEACFDEISCACGDAVLVPPIPCGTELVARCTRPCAVIRPCGHVGGHNCHSGECPSPCETLVSIPCLGAHRTLPFQCGALSAAALLDPSSSAAGSDPARWRSCQFRCGAGLRGCHHRCEMPCHDHDAWAAAAAGVGAKCTQICGRPVDACVRGVHACRLECSHAGPCRSSTTTTITTTAGKTTASVVVEDVKRCLVRLKATCTCGAITPSSPSTILTCSDLQTHRFTITHTAPGATGRDTLTLDCARSTHPACVESRRATVIRLAASVAADRVLDGNGNVSAAAAPPNALWFRDLPASITMRDVSAFVGRCVRHVTTTTAAVRFRALSRAEVEAAVIVGRARRRGKEFVVVAEDGVPERLWRGVVAVAVAVAARSVKDAWAVGVTVEDRGVVAAHGGDREVGSDDGLRGEDRQDNASVVESKDELSVAPPPAPPANVFEMLGGADNDDDDDIEGDDGQPDDGDRVPAKDLEANDLDASAPGDAKKKRVRKKKKPKEVEVVEAAIETDVKRIEDVTIAPAPKNICAFAKCKEKLNSLAQLCAFCNRKFCMSHRLPEVHAEACAIAMKASSQSTFKNDAKLAIGLSKKDGVSGGSGGPSKGLAKERSDARARLAERISSARKGGKK